MYLNNPGLTVQAALSIILQDEAHKEEARRRRANQAWAEAVGAAKDRHQEHINRGLDLLSDSQARRLKTMA